MIQNKNMSSEEFKVLQNFIMVNPEALETGELKTESGLVLAMEQNNSVINRPTTGKVMTVGPLVESLNVGDSVLWVETDGLEIELSDGIFLILKETSIIGYKNEHVK